MTNDENKVLIDTEQIRAVSTATNLDDVSNVFHKVGDFFNEIVAVQNTPQQSAEQSQQSDTAEKDLDER